MTILEALQERHSIRRYKDTPLSEETVSALQQKIKEVNAEGKQEILFDGLHTVGFRHSQTAF